MLPKCGISKMPAFSIGCRSSSLASGKIAKHRIAPQRLTSYWQAESSHRWISSSPAQLGGTVAFSAAADQITGTAIAAQ
jgi:hypothetical protein